MGKNSRIEWTHHTFNPWWGCTKVSEACKHCYAEAWSKRVGQQLWGPKADRRFFGERHWREPVKWNDDANAKNTRFRVFCSSVANVLEDRGSLDYWGEKFWDLEAFTQRKIEIEREGEGRFPAALDGGGA